MNNRDAKVAYDLLSSKGNLSRPSRMKLEQNGSGPDVSHLIMWEQSKAEERLGTSFKMSSDEIKRY